MLSVTLPFLNIKLESVYVLFTKSTPLRGIIVEVGSWALKELEPVQTLELFWIKGNVVNPWLFKVKKLTNWVFVVAVNMLVGNDVLNVLDPVQTLELFWTEFNVVKLWLFKVKKLTNWVFVVAVNVDVGSDELNVLVPVHSLEEFYIPWTGIEST